MKRYAKYKDSGVEWIGDIPEGWASTKLKSIGHFYGGLVGKTGEDFRSEDYSTMKPFIKFTNISNNLYVPLNDFGYVVINENDKQNLVRQYDLFFLMSSETKEDVGKCSCLKNEVGELYLNTFCKGYRIYDNSVSPLFLNYLLSGKIYRDILSNEGNGFTRINLRLDRVNNLQIFLPPLIEQEQIVSYLDEKTSYIDKLLAISKRKIGLLKEQRSSIINQVVTKGLNPNAKMKHSGVEWIGDIPEGWGVLPLKYLVKENSNSLSNSTDPNYKLKYIEISDINSNGTISNTTDYIFSNCPSRCRRILKKGDVAISTVRTYLKSIFIIENEVIDLICSTGFSVLSPNKNVNSKHLFYMVRSEWFISSIISKSEGVSYPSIQSDKLMNTFVLNIPPIEQEQIVAYLNEKINIIDKSISIEERRIGLLKEYRQSIISQVVTGKIKVTADE